MKTAAEGWAEEQEKSSEHTPQPWHPIPPSQHPTYQVTVNIEVEASNPQLAEELVATILDQAQDNHRINGFWYMPAKALDHPSPIRPRSNTTP